MCGLLVFVFGGINEFEKKVVLLDCLFSRCLQIFFVLFRFIRFRFRLEETDLDLAETDSDLAHIDSDFADTDLALGGTNTDFLVLNLD